MTSFKLGFFNLKFLIGLIAVDFWEGGAASPHPLPKNQRIIYSLFTEGNILTLEHI
jgi:hypothetical protein